MKDDRTMTMMMNRTASERRRGSGCSGLTQKQVDEPSALQFSDGHDGSDGLHETNDSQGGVRKPGRKDVLVQPNSVVTHL